MQRKIQAGLFLVAAVIGLLAQEKTPKLTDSQKLEIRTAQVEFFQAKTTLESTQQYQAFQQAQVKLNEVVRRVQKDAGVDPAKFTLQPSLEFEAVPQKPEPPKEKP